MPLPLLDQFRSIGGAPELLMPVAGVQKDYLQSALDEMHKRYQPIDGYFSQGLGLDSLRPGRHLVYWRAMCMRSSASSSWISSPLTSTVTLWIVPVNLKGLA